MPTVRLLPFESLPGPANMAADEALLESAAAGVATLRFYAWAEPTLSLGYFQPAADRLADPRLATLPWLRRATGGAALVHHHEVTYALALPAGSAWQSGEPWGCRFHHIVTAALAPLGAKTESVVCGRERKLGPVLCFLDQTPGDLIADGAKVVGSAQRKNRGALLQHGGILLGRSEYAPDLAGLKELTGIELSPESAATAIAAKFATDTGWDLIPSDWAAEELARRKSIETERYANRDWNEKR